MIAAAPLLVAALSAAVLLGKRRADVEEVKAKPAGAAEKAKSVLTQVRSKRTAHKPRNMMRYYSMGLLITMLERDATRKALIGALKWARQRA